MRVLVVLGGLVAVLAVIWLSWGYSLQPGYKSAEPPRFERPAQSIQTEQTATETNPG